ncbi:MAG TPA: hypothetical protein VL486_13785 [Verrucomicrobiae bacterium]|nr:hypothetical protein [Verrucomicrobiae bacterium]
MNDEQLNELFRAARTDRADTSRAEYGFETRLAARLRAERERFVPWPAIAWRLAPAFAVIVAAAAVWLMATPGINSTDLRSAIADDEVERMLVTHFTGD